MARWAMVHEQSGFVANMVEWDGNLKTWKPPPGYIMVEDTAVVAGPGFTYVDGEFIPPPNNNPEE